MQSAMAGVGDPDKYFDQIGAARFITAELGIPTSPTQVRRLRESGVLAFFMLGKKLVISDAEIRAAFRKLQIKAVEAARP
jgi:hypothetical protein